MAIVIATKELGVILRGWHSTKRKEHAPILREWHGTKRKEHAVILRENFHERQWHTEDARYGDMLWNGENGDRNCRQGTFYNSYVIHRDTVIQNYNGNLSFIDRFPYHLVPGIFQQTMFDYYLVYIRSAIRCSVSLVDSGLQADGRHDLVHWMSTEILCPDAPCMEYLPTLP